jgi:ribosomal-protein-alanine N-acetyltransferase
MKASFRCVPLSPALQPALTTFYAGVVSAGLNRDFHPHPFTAGQAAAIARYEGRDYYTAAMADGVMAGYGMLRGWDEGYDIPSLGIAILPDYQRQGLGRLLMAHLHAVARERGAGRIRLKVYARNSAAIALYSSLGYALAPIDGDQFLGTLELAPRPSSTI